MYLTSRLIRYTAWLLCHMELFGINGESARRGAAASRGVTHAKRHHRVRTYSVRHSAGTSDRPDSSRSRINHPLDFLINAVL